MQKNYNVSVIIASHRPEMVKNVLTSLRAQMADSATATEIIVISDYPNGHLQEEFSNCTWLHTPDKSISRKRNCGINLASAPLCAFIDDDCTPSQDWIMQGVHYMYNHPEVSAVEGKTTIEHRGESSASQTREYRRLEKQGFRTNNLFFRTDHLRAVGGFDERFTVQREDIDLAFTAFKRGYRYSYSEAIKVTHAFRSWERWDLLKNCWNRRFDPLLYKKHPALYRKHIGSPLTPTIKTMLLMLLAVTVTLFKRRGTPYLLSLGGCLCLAAGLRRTGVVPFSFIHLFFETVQSAAAPFVTLYALAWGSIRYRILFLA